MASSFKSAFRAARESGDKSFMWNGTKYNTKLADDTPTPPRRPASVSSSETKWADPGAKENGRPRDDEPEAPRKPMDGWADPGAIENEKRETGSYRRGGYVPARASGKRMYAKGGMVKGKC